MVGKNKYLVQDLSILGKVQFKQPDLNLKRLSHSVVIWSVKNYQVHLNRALERKGIPMSEDWPPIDLTSVHEPLSRRSLFKFGARIGAGLVAFVPAAAMLLQNVPVANAMSTVPEGCCCTDIACYNSQYKRWLTFMNCNGTNTCTCTAPPDC